MHDNFLIELRLSIKVLRNGGMMGKTAFFAVIFLLFVCATSIAQVIYFCPKCNSENVSIVTEDKETEEVVARKPFSEFSLWDEGFNFRFYRTIQRWHAKCLDCGYSKSGIEKSEPRPDRR